MEARVKSLEEHENRRQYILAQSSYRYMIKRLVLGYIYWILMWPFGLFGKHHLLRHDARLAFMYSTSCGLFFIGWAVDAMLLPLQSSGDGGLSKKGSWWIWRFIRGFYSLAYTYILTWTMAAFINNTLVISMTSVLGLWISGEVDFMSVILTIVLGLSLDWGATNGYVRMNFNPTLQLWLLLRVLGRNINFPDVPDIPSAKTEKWLNRLQKVSALAFLAWLFIARPNLDTFISTYHIAIIHFEYDFNALTGFEAGWT